MSNNIIFVVAVGDSTIASNGCPDPYQCQSASAKLVTYSKYIVSPIIYRQTAVWNRVYKNCTKLKLVEFLHFCQTVTSTTNSDFMPAVGAFTKCRYDFSVGSRGYGFTVHYLFLLCLFDSIYLQGLLNATMGPFHGVMGPSSAAAHGLAAILRLGHQQRG